jgi:hypothetical protein
MGPVVSALHASGGGFHFKAAGMGGYMAGKLNANFPGTRRGARPTIQGLVLLCDAEQGEPLGVFDSTAINRSAYGCCHGSCGAIPGKERRAGREHRRLSRPKAGRRSGRSTWFGRERRGLRLRSRALTS